MKKVFLVMTLFVLCASISVNAQSRRNLWFIGDGSMAAYVADSTQARGWVQLFEQYLSPKMEVANDAKLGLSVKVFMDNQGMKQLAKQNPRTILFLQVGTNDLKEYIPAQHSSLEALQRRLHEIIVLARKNKINVVLCTPLAQPYYHEGQLIDRLGGYAEVIRRSAMHDYVALLDLEKATREWLQGMTAEEAAAYYVTIEPSQLADGEFQLNEAGATEVAKMAKEAILEVKSKKLKKVLKK